MGSSPRWTAVLGGVGAAVLLLAGCSPAGSSADPAATPSGAAAGSPTATASPGYAPTTPPPPGGTFTPEPGSWVGTEPPPGYDVTLLTTDENPRTRVLSAAVRAWARDAGVALDEVVADRTHHYIAAIQDAVSRGSDLVVTTGDGLVDPLALVTASNLQQQFLVVGAELAEPTINVTAADWTGASFRGEGLGRPTTFDPSTFTPERADRAVRAGVTAVLTGLNGTVVWVR